MSNYKSIVRIEDLRPDISNIIKFIIIKFIAVNLIRHCFINTIFEQFSSLISVVTSTVCNIRKCETYTKVTCMVCPGPQLQYMC